MTEQEILALVQRHERTCVVPGCGRLRYSAQGYCNAHRVRIRTIGAVRPNQPLRIARYGDTPCVVRGCARVVVSKGRCAKHYQYWRRHGKDCDTETATG